MTGRCRRFCGRWFLGYRPACPRDLWLIVLLILAACGPANTPGSTTTDAAQPVTPTTGLSSAAASPPGPACARDYYLVRFHFRGRSYGMLKQIDLPAGGPIPWPLGNTVDTTFLPWQTGGYFPAGVPIRAVQGAPDDERLVVQGKDYALLYCALPEEERTTPLIRTVVVVGTIAGFLPDICTATRWNGHCPGGVAKIYSYRVAVDERLAGALPDTIRYLDVLHATWKATALVPQPGMRVLLFLRPASDQGGTVAALPPDPVQAYWLAAPDAAYLVENGGVRWMENPLDNPSPPLATVRQQVQATFAGVQSENPLRPQPIPIFAAASVRLARKPGVLPSRDCCSRSAR